MAADQPASTEWLPAPVALPAAPLPVLSDQDHLVKQGATWAGTGKKARLIRLSLANDFALVALEDGTIHQIDVKTGASTRSWSGKAGQVPIAMEITYDDKQVVLQYDKDARLYVHSIADGSLLRALGEQPKFQVKAKAKTTTFALAPDPRFLAAGDSNGKSILWNLETGEKIKETRDNTPEWYTTSQAFSADCHHLYVTRHDRPTVEVLKLPSLEAEPAFLRKFGKPVRLSMSFDGKSMLVLHHNRFYELLALGRIEGGDGLPDQFIGSGMITKGEPENCFFNQAASLVCNYFGRTAFEYRRPQVAPAASGGGQAGDTEDVVAVNVGRAGHVAATAFDNGSVQFFELPGMLKAPATRRHEITEQLRSLFSQKSYDELDQLANKLLDDVQLDSGRAARSTLLASALAEPAKKTKEGWKAHLSVLEEWLDGKPESRAAMYMAGDARKLYAWFLRGGDVAARTGPGAVIDFETELRKAETLLATADDQGGPCATISASRITVAMGLGRDKQQILEIWKRGVKQAPDFPPLHQHLAYALLPRWGGEVGDVAAMAAEARRDLPGEAGLWAYGEMAERFLRYETPINYVEAGFTGTELEDAARSQLAAYPDSIQALNFAALIACLRQDHEAAVTRFGMLGRSVDRQLWRPSSTFETFRTWAQSRQVPHESEMSLMVSWAHLAQISLSEDGMELVTLSNDSYRQFRVWDLSRGQVEREIAIPRETRPWGMSSKGRFIGCAVGQQDRGVLLFDAIADKVLTWNDAKLPARARFSHDERELALYTTEGQVTIFDLQNPAKEPSRRFKLDKRANALEIPDQCKSWRAVVAGEGGLRVLSDDGKDLFEPQKKWHANVLCAIPGSSRVLMGGISLVAVVDADTGKVTAFRTSNPTQPGSDRAWTATVSDDGKWAAIAINRTGRLRTDQTHPIEIWDLEKGTRAKELAGHESQVSTLSFSHDNQRLASGDELGFVQIWSLK